MTTRRSFLATNLVGAAGYTSIRRWIPAAAAYPSQSSDRPANADANSDRDFWNDWPSHIAGKMNDAREKRLANLATINSSTKVQERTAMIRATLWKLLGGPLERTPLNPKVTGRHRS